MKIGTIEIKNPIALAPMEHITDISFRLICKQLGADFVYTEFTSSEALIRDIGKAVSKIQVSDEERPVAIQLFGNNEQSFAEAAKIAETFSPDFIDINCGCCSKNHVSRGEGAGLLRDLSLLERIVKSVVRATKVPVTVKTRLGWDAKSIVILDAAKIVEQAGAQALTVHCRTKAQGYKGKADWQWLEKIKKEISIPLIGNGDVTTVEDAKAMFETGCDGVMIGRGALVNPWIFKQAKFYLETGQYLAEPSLEERINLCIKHLKLSVAQKGLRDGIVPFRKHYAGYLRGLPNIAKLRVDLMQLVEVEQIVDRVYEFRKAYSG